MRGGAIEKGYIFKPYLDTIQESQILVKSIVEGCPYIKLTKRYRFFRPSSYFVYTLNAYVELNMSKICYPKLSTHLFDDVAYERSLL